MPNIGPLEIAIVLAIVLIIFGPKRLPDLGRSLGRGMREFKESVTGTGKDEDEPSEPAQIEAAAPASADAETAEPPAEEQETGARAGAAGDSR